MLRLLLCGITFFLLVSCSGGILDGDLEKNLQELDKIYGKCDNPNRQFTKGQYKICKDKERAAGNDGIVDEPLNLTELFKGIRTGENTVYANNTVNSHLWNASLALLEPYNIKIADSQGGVLSTEWIMKKESPNKRCLIKINIISQELVSNGVKTKFICEQKEMQEWYDDEQDYAIEEKNITLKILEAASRLKNSEQISN